MNVNKDLPQKKLPSAQETKFVIWKDLFWNIFTSFYSHTSTFLPSKYNLLSFCLAVSIGM